MSKGKKIFGNAVKVVVILLLLVFSIFSVRKSSPINPKLENNLDLPSVSTDSVLKIGWSSVNITPVEFTPLVGYAQRENASSVMDSLYIRTVVLSSGGQKVAVIAFDLLILTPNIRDAIKSKMQELGIDMCYFSASHSHHSFGGYAEGFLGDMVIGEDDKVAQYLIDDALKSIELSLSNMHMVTDVKVEKRLANIGVNRLTHEQNIEDELKSIRFKTDLGFVNLLSSKSHPTIIGKKNDAYTNGYSSQILKQYPGVFNLYMAGTMGSIGPFVPNSIQQEKKVMYFANKLLNGSLKADSVSINEIQFELQSNSLNHAKPRFHLTESLKTRPWLFDVLVGEFESEVQVVRLNNILMVSLPCELSYEYMKSLDVIAKQKGIELLVTSFNGSHLGYCVPVEYFSIQHMETREMNWLGKYGGDYFHEVVKMLIEKQ